MTVNGLSPRFPIPAASASTGISAENFFVPFARASEAIRYRRPATPDLRTSTKNSYRLRDRLRRWQCTFFAANDVQNAAVSADILPAASSPTRAPLPWHASNPPGQTRSLRLADALHRQTLPPATPNSDRPSLD